MTKLKLDLLARRLEDSIRKFETAQETFAVNKKEWTEHYMKHGTAESDAKVKASGVPVVKEAATDCAYFRDRANMYANTIQAVIALQKEKGL